MNKKFYKHGSNSQIYAATKKGIEGKLGHDAPKVSILNPAWKYITHQERNSLHNYGFFLRFKGYTVNSQFDLNSEEVGVREWKKGFPGTDELHVYWKGNCIRSTFEQVYAFARRNKPIKLINKDYVEACANRRGRNSEVAERLIYLDKLYKSYFSGNGTKR